jgi:hypothetical protein
MRPTDVPSSNGGLLEPYWNENVAQRPAFDENLAEFWNNVEYAFPGTDAEEMPAYHKKLETFRNKNLFRER